MKRVVSLVLLSLIALACLQCRKDVFVEPPASLLGEYEGVYIYKFAGQAEQEQPITWRFTSISYRVSYDEDNGTGRLFCDAAGTYELEGGRVIFAEVDPNVKASLCTTAQNPVGVFSIDQSTDTLLMIQPDGDILKTIKLVLIEE